MQTFAAVEKKTDLDLDPWGLDLDPGVF